MRAYPKDLTLSNCNCNTHLSIWPHSELLGVRKHDFVEETVQLITTLNTDLTKAVMQTYWGSSNRVGVRIMHRGWGSRAEVIFHIGKRRKMLENSIKVMLMPYVDT